MTKKKNQWTKIVGTLTGAGRGEKGKQILRRRVIVTLEYEKLTALVTFMTYACLTC